MEIYPLGHSSFKIKGKTATIVTDPYDSKNVGLKFPKTENVDIVTISHDHSDHNSSSNILEEPFIISGPGEYEIKGVTVVGTASFHDEENGKLRGPNTIYCLIMDQISICHLGDLGHKLSDAQLEKIGNIDILLIPVGGHYTIDPKTAFSVVTQIEPKIVIPMHYKKTGMAKEFDQLAEVGEFLKEMGVQNVIPQPKLVTSFEKLPETTTVMVLENV